MEYSDTPTSTDPPKPVFANTDEPADALEQSGFDVELDPEKTLAQLSKLEGRLEGHAEGLAILKRRIDWTQEELTKRSDANKGRFPLLRDRITKAGPLIQVDTKLDEFGRVKVYGGKAASGGVTGQGFFFAWPQTLEPVPEPRPPAFESGSYKAGWHALRDRSRRVGAIATFIICVVAALCALALT